MRAPCSAACRSSSVSNRRPTPSPRVAGGDPHALQLRRSASVELQGSAAHRLTAQRGDEEQAHRQAHLDWVGRQAASGIESGLETAVELGEVAAQAQPGDVVVGVDDDDLDSDAVSNRSTSAIASTSRARCVSLSGSSIERASSSLRWSRRCRSARPLAVRRAVRTRRSRSAAPTVTRPSFSNDRRSRLR